MCLSVILILYNVVFNQLPLKYRGKSKITVTGELPFTFVTNTQSFIEKNFTSTASVRFGQELNVGLVSAWFQG